MVKKKILYFMHLDWYWIKQRPQFIAEGLSDHFDIKVIYMASKQLIFKNTKSGNEKKLDIKPLFRIPFYENKFFYELNKIYLRFCLNIIIKRYKPDFLWITFPQLYDYIPQNINCNIIYDCMDDATRFKFKDHFKSKIIDLEKKLVNDASLIFVPSNKFLENFNEKYKSVNKSIVVRNAFSGLIEDIREKETKLGENYIIGYVGTFSELIDFDMVQTTLKEIKNIEYHFIGPYEFSEKINHSRIKFYGVVPYDKLYNYVKNFDCLILPFKLIESVEIADPVKIYGYINYSKPILSIYYKELNYFNQFIYFYSDTKELIGLMKKMIKIGFKRKYSSNSRLKFLESNSWEIRVSEIIKYLKEL